MKNCAKIQFYKIKWIALIFFFLFYGITFESKSQSPFMVNPDNIVGGKLKDDADNKLNKIVIIGASYVRAWPVQVLGGMQVINKGVNGEQSFEMLHRFDQDVVMLKPKFVIIWGFINDIHRTKRENMDAGIAKARHSIQEIVRLAKQNQIEPVLATEVTIRGQDDFRSMVAGWIGAIRNKTSYQEYVNSQVLETNQWIRKYAEQNQILLLDFQPVISDEKGFRKKEFATEDGTHISPAAYEQLTTYANTVFEALRTH